MTFLQMCVTKIQTLMVIFRMTVLIQNPAKKKIPYNLAERVIVLETDPKKVKLRINEFRTLLKNKKYPDHIVSSSFYNAKLQGPATKPKNNFNNVPFVTTFHENIDNKIIMKNIKRKIENSPI